MRELRRRIIAFVALPFAELEKVALQRHLDRLGDADDGLSPAFTHKRMDG